MGHDYRAVQWNPYKVAFDWALALGVVAFLGAFVAASTVTFPAEQRFSEAQIGIRALGACAFGLFTLILAIGPATRLWPRLSPLLYNRRHLGVVCFALGLLHGVLSTVWYHGFSDVNPLVSLLTSNQNYQSISGFPFESLGLAALIILFAMAATSHDFFNTNLGPGLWKAIHMAAYPAYALLVGHIVLGAIQSEKSLAYPIVIGGASALVAGLHLVAGIRQQRLDRVATPEAEGWIRVGLAADIPDKRARIVAPAKGEPIAVFRDGVRIYAITNRCRHQGGPLGEGRIIDGCVTCPWHGFQYRPEDGVAPPPYKERIATYPTRIVDGVAFVLPRANPLGAPNTPSVMAGGAA